MLERVLKDTTGDVAVAALLPVMKGLYMSVQEVTQMALHVQTLSTAEAFPRHI